MAKARPSTRKTNGPSSQESTYGKRELVFVAQSDLGLRVGPTAEFLSPRGEVRGLSRLLQTAGVSVTPLFGLEEDRIRDRVAALPEEAGVPDLGVYYHVDAPDERLDDLADSLRKLGEVAAAYVKPAGAPPVADMPDAINEMLPSGEDAPPATPDFSARQIYLNAAPAGIDARYAWRFRGGRGQNVRIIDCEWGWRFTHEDLSGNQGGVVIGTASTDDNHGTAVLGEFSGDVNALGILGICSDALAMAASFQTLPSATVIRQAADRLRAGDIILLEIHRRGPDGSGVGQDGFIAIEWWPDDFAAIRYAIARGVIVVEAAGNGARNLDAAIFNTRPAGFPTTWTNPFNPANPSSGAVVVGAGAPPPGTHGRDHGPDRSRLDFSNHGRRVDVQGWGREVTSTGYGDLQAGANRNLWYTDQFSGTSSASPIVVGALGCVQGILRARNRPLLTPATARQLLRATGSPQQDAPGRPRKQRIGNRPDLRQLIGRAVPGGPPDAEGSEVTADGETTLNLTGRVTINLRSANVTINAGSNIE